MSAVEMVTLADRRPVAILIVEVRARPLAVDRVLRLARAEREVFKQSFPVALPKTGAETKRNVRQSSAKLTVLCSHPDVVVTCAAGKGKEAGGHSFLNSCRSLGEELLRDVSLESSHFANPHL